MTKKCGPCGRITWHTETGKCGQCGAVEVSREVNTETESKKYSPIFDAFRYKSPIITHLYEVWDNDFVQKINKDGSTT